MDNLDEMLVIRDGGTRDTEVPQSNIYVNMHDLKKKIRRISSFGVEISKLDSLSNDVSGLISSDYFTVSRMFGVEVAKTGQAASEMNVRYGTIRSKILDDFKRKDHTGVISMTGKWMFGTMNQSRIYMETSAIAHQEDVIGFNPNTEIFPTLDASEFQNNHSAINFEFFKTKLLPLIDRLSSIYYNVSDKMFTYPSNRNDVETTITIGTANRFPPSKIFGNAVAWGNIITDGKDRMLLGEGECEENNFTRYGSCLSGEMNSLTKNKAPGTVGGEERVVIAPEHFPAHTHKIQCDTVSFTCSFHLRGTIASICCTKVTNNYMKPGSSGLQHQATQGTIVPFKMTGSATLSTKDLWGNSIRIHEAVYDASGKRITTSRTSSHNNVPPVIFVRMSRRTK